jgi:peptidoglycan hydrolase-like protein with peptidoglycan-binding domain
MRRATPLLTLAVLSCAAPAQAQDAPPTLSVRAQGIAVHPATTVTRVRFTLNGKLTPYVAGQKVVVRLYRGKRKIKARALTLQADGRFKLGIKPRVPGRLKIQVSHRATPELGTAVAKPMLVRVVRSTASPSSRGPAVRFLQRILRRKHYAVNVTGSFDADTSRAVLAFRKLTNRARLPVADRDVFKGLLNGEGAFKVRYRGDGKHVEGDLTHQVLALINPGGKVFRIYPTASGAPGTPTVLGRFHVYSKTPGINAKGMVYSSYFIRGYAIHGYRDVPSYPASHGCMRVPIPDAIAIFNWLNLGDGVDVYYR